VPYRAVSYRPPKLPSTYRRGVFTPFAHVFRTFFSQNPSPNDGFLCHKLRLRLHFGHLGFPFGCCGQTAPLSAQLSTRRRCVDGNSISTLKAGSHSQEHYTGAHPYRGTWKTRDLRLQKRPTYTPLRVVTRSVGCEMRLSIAKIRSLGVFFAHRGFTQRFWVRPADLASNFPPTRTELWPLTSDRPSDFPIWLLWRNCNL